MGNPFNSYKDGCRDGTEFFSLIIFKSQRDWLQMGPEMSQADSGTDYTQWHRASTLKGVPFKKAMYWNHGEASGAGVWEQGVCQAVGIRVGSEVPPHLICAPLGD